MTTLRRAVTAVTIGVGGVVQGVGFRPCVYRLAMAHGVCGWVLNGEDGVRVHAEGDVDDVAGFVDALRAAPPPAAVVASFDVAAVEAGGFVSFEIRESRGDGAPTVRISPDLKLCDECRAELFDSGDRRFGYPYVNCTNCGPRYSIVLGLPYDRVRTTMRDWPLCAECSREYHDPADRRFHAQPVACASCGPHYRLIEGDLAATRGTEAISRAAGLLACGAIVAVKGIGGYHLACDAFDNVAVATLRERKYRKERPFAVMARDLGVARELIDLSDDAERMLTSVARPIVLARARVEIPGVAPDNRELGVMLPYTPLHELLFAAGAPRSLVMTSANRSSEPIAYLDDDALATLTGIADAFLAGERPIARRIDDSIVRVGPQGPTILRRARGLAPAALATFPRGTPVIALGADLKNAVTLVVDGQAFGGQHAGDLQHFAARQAFGATVRDLCAMYEVDPARAIIAHDAHPQYYSTEFAASLGDQRVAIQHHRAHIASVLAEREAWETPVVGFAFDGTGYGDDGAIWGGEVFAGSLTAGLERVAHLRTVPLPGGDAAARFPVQAAAGFLHALGDRVAFEAKPFAFPERFFAARELIAKGVRTFPTSSMGRLFDAIAAIAGFTREQTFEGQAAMWLEHQAWQSGTVAPYAFGLAAGDFDSAPVVRAAIADRAAGRKSAEIARAFHGAVAAAIIALSDGFRGRPVVVSGGVFQNALLVELLANELGERLWMNHSVPPNDGGISLGQAAIAAIQGARA